MVYLSTWELKVHSILHSGDAVYLSKTRYTVAICVFHVKKWHFMHRINIADMVQYAISKIKKWSQSQNVLLKIPIWTVNTSAVHDVWKEADRFINASLVQQPNTQMWSNQCSFLNETGSRIARVRGQNAFHRGWQPSGLFYTFSAPHCSLSLCFKRAVALLSFLWTSLLKNSITLCMTK